MTIIKARYIPVSKLKKGDQVQIDGLWYAVVEDVRPAVGSSKMVALELRANSFSERSFSAILPETYEVCYTKGDTDG